MRLLATILLIHSVASVGAFSAPLARCTRVCRASRLLRACQEELGAESDVLYASLYKRRSQIAARSDATSRERDLVAALKDMWPNSERAQSGLWQHWYGEEGEEARRSLELAQVALENPSAADEAPALVELMGDFPDWAEPINRLATLRFLQGRFDDSAELCLKVLRLKPWHFGALSGLVMCYVKLDKIEEANRWAIKAMPPSGAERNQWVESMLEIMDAKLVEISDISVDDSTSSAEQ